MVKETDFDTIAALNSEGISLKQEETKIADHVCSAFILPVFSQVAFTSVYKLLPKLMSPVLFLFHGVLLPW